MLAKNVSKPQRGLLASLPRVVACLQACHVASRQAVTWRAGKLATFLVLNLTGISRSGGEASCKSHSFEIHRAHPLSPGTESFSGGSPPEGSGGEVSFLSSSLFLRASCKALVVDGVFSLPDQDFDASSVEYQLLPS
ncbi:hypothetical protein ZIOFF_011189 [Zingiber officinale]|uniref:Uncharacterized protein n=1 Tax=Zingiber officinale TaxID=94328 RepID=A0A8J5I3R2_ZINOF|nr:hypothetical protein ZIOFF_011189 [Zingiber officinale]